MGPSSWEKRPTLPCTWAPPPEMGGLRRGSSPQQKRFVFDLLRISFFIMKHRKTS